MGRLFLTEIEGPIYKCKYCEIGLAVYEPDHNKSQLFFEYPDSYGDLYYFEECYNVVIGTDQVRIGTIEGDIDHLMCQVFCIHCGSHIGLYFDSEPRYNEGNFYINRLKIQGPPNGSDNENLGDGSNDENAGNETSEGSDDDDDDDDEILQDQEMNDA